jgi:hypothetical protein
MHSGRGVLLACTPVSLAVWAFFRRFVRPAVLQFMPTALAKTVRPANASLILASVAVLVGATTHVIWDGFTHGSGWAVTMWSSLRHEVAPSIAPVVPWFKLLQHASTLVGLATLACWALSGYGPNHWRLADSRRRSNDAPPESSRPWPSRVSWAEFSMFFAPRPTVSPPQWAWRLSEPWSAAQLCFSFWA